MPEDNDGFNWGRILEITAEVLKLIAEKGFKTEAAIDKVVTEYDLSDNEREKIEEEIEKVL
ncbi:hypothetical protein JCM16358_03850 [Halanaerocella petrolearia]